MKTVSSEPTTTPNRETAREILRRRRQAYSRLFNPENADARVVLQDLMRFCRAAPGQTTFDLNSKVQDLLCGRNEVYRRIADHTGLTLDELFHLYAEKK